MTYRHTQVGTAIIVSLGIFFVLMVITLPGAGWPLAGTLVMILLGGCLVLFPTLTVAIETDHVSCRFGPGLIRKTIPLSDIQAVHAVRNSWFSGWGIRWLLDGTTMWNVSGFDAVEVVLRSNARFRIGTNEPDKLTQALETAIHAQR